MKTFYCILLFLFFSGCGNNQKNSSNYNNSTATKTDTLSVDKPLFQYTDLQLENFLDSVENLATEPLAVRVSITSDSIFRNQQRLGKDVDEADFLILRKAISEKDEINRVLDLETIKRIFGEVQIDSSFKYDGEIPITFYSFDKKKSDLNKFAICLGHPNLTWDCTLYFFKGNKIISKHNIFHRYGLVLEHFKDKDGRTIVYYKEYFGSGSGIWQFNFYFYKYQKDELIPALNVLGNGNLQCCWGVRVFWLESIIVNNDPLTLKMIYYQELMDTSNIGHRIIDDSTFVQYSWDKKANSFVGDYEKAKINEPQTLTFYLADNELLFINTYYKILKNNLNDQSKRQPTLNYLNKIKNYYDNK
jgi:hypothetical protein